MTRAINTTTNTTTTAPTQSQTMRAITQVRYGSADVLQPNRIARPTPKAEEVLVEVRAAGLDRGTWHLMTGLPKVVRLAIGVRRPRRQVPGFDVAGRVVAVGSGVTRFSEGDEVFGIGRGTFAQFATAHQDKLAIKPPALSFELAAAVSISGLTALQGLTDVGRLEAGQRVLITGASGGVGSFAVQIAKALGADVTGVCSTAKIDLVRALGADQVVDHTTVDLTAGSPTSCGERYDLILDIAGNTPVLALRRMLAVRGTLVIAGGEGGEWLGGLDRQLRAMLLSPFVRQRLTTFVSKEHHRGIDRLVHMIDAGVVTPAVERTYPLAEAAAAMQHLIDGAARGKLVVVP